MRYFTLPVLIALLVGCDMLSGSSGSSSSGSSGTSSSGSDGGSSSSGPLEAGEVRKPEPAGPLSGLLSGTDTSLPPPAVMISRKQCGDMEDGGPVEEGSCITADIECDQTIIGHTAGGVQKFNTRFYEKHFCTPATTDHDGGDERVYRFWAPPDRQRIYFYLDTPCADLDLAVMKAPGQTECPSIDSDIADCEMWPKDGRKREIVDVPSTGGGAFLAVVEGKGGEEGAFALTVQCGPWR